MCGIAGAVAAGQLEFDQATLRRMMDRLVHRGPDCEGVWVEAGAYLGFRRLSIIDTSEAGNQPMVSHDGRLVLIFNGEIYNCADIRAMLESKERINWRGHSDSEIFLEAIARWGVRTTLDRVDAMFAFALWDRNTRTLTLARDPFGEKPLVYADLGHSIIFASEFSALETVGALSLTPAIENIAQYLRRGYVPEPLTIAAGASKLLPGSTMTWRSGCPAKTDHYWSASEAARVGGTSQISDPRAAVSRLHELLAAAVSRRMIADVPLGAFLSGGIDSSTVVALMQEVSERPVRTFSIGFPDSGYDEGPHAKRVAEHLGTDHTELRVDEQAALSVVPQLGRMYDEPFADASQIPTYLVSKLARTGVTVALTGDGGDELFEGYARYELAPTAWRWMSRLPARDLLAKAIEHFPNALFDVAASGLAAMLPAGVNARGLAAKLRTSGPLLRSASAEDVYLSYMDRWPTPANLLADSDAGEAASDWACPPTFRDPRDWMMWWDWCHHLPGDILAKVDRAAMAVSLETRIPILDRQVAEFACRLTPAMKWRDGAGKWPLRQVLYKYVPREMVERPKMGFAVPLEAWLRGPLKGWASDLLAAARLKRQGFLNPEVVAAAWTEFQHHGRRSADQIWVLLMLQGWLEARGQ